MHFTFTEKNVRVVKKCYFENFLYKYDTYRIFHLFSRMVSNIIVISHWFNFPFSDKKEKNIVIMEMKLNLE